MDTHFEEDRGMSKGQDQGQSKEKLPNLVLTEIAKSERFDGIESICPWKDYTIVISKTEGEIVIIDSQAKRTTFFDPLSKKTLEVDWWKVRNTKFVSSSPLSVVDDNRTHKSSKEIGLSEIPIELYPFAKKSLEGKISFSLPYSFAAMDINAANRVLDRYILLSSDEGGFGAFDTMTENGITLPPNEWKRLNPDDNIPEELIKEALKIIDKTRVNKQISDKYSIIVTDVGINVMEKGKDENLLLFSETIPLVGKNIVVDPSNPSVIYYCQTNNPSTIKKIDLSGDPSTWKTVSVEWPTQYKNINDLQLDSSGNFFLFCTKEGLVVVTKDTLEEVAKISGLSMVNFDNLGNIRAINKDGCLVIYKTNFDKLANDINKQKKEKTLKNIDIRGLFEKKSDQGKAESVEIFKELNPIKDDYTRQFREKLDELEGREGIDEIKQAVENLKKKLKPLSQKEITYVVSEIEEIILKKEKIIVTQETQKLIEKMRGLIDAGLSINSISDLRTTVSALKASEALLNEATRSQFRNILQEFEEKSSEYFRKHSEMITKDIKAKIEGVKTKLKTFTSKQQMDDWLEFELPKYRLELANLAKDLPLETSETFNTVMSARVQLQEIADINEKKFKDEYARVREKAAERVETVMTILHSDINGFIDRFKNKNFSNRKVAEQYLSSSESRKTLEAQIDGLTSSSPDLAKELRKFFLVSVSNTLADIERGSTTQIVATGQQMVAFGEVMFPRWEAKVKEKTERRVEIFFDDDKASHGPGIKPGEIMGDVSVRIRTADGKMETVRLYQGWNDENEWRFGLHTYEKIGVQSKPSYVSASEFAEIQKNFKEWIKSTGFLKEQFEEKRRELKEFYSTGPGPRGKENKEIWPTEVLDEWRKERDKKVKEFADFCIENNIPLLRRIDQIGKEPDVEYSNGKGFVPEWQPHWVLDPQTENDLAKMAEKLKMQLDLQEGILNLKGHAGTGKDVRIKMFCNRTNRPYFGIDGTKWTTEFELSEDITLESKDGASQTIKVPSAVLNGITTPGAVVYFNEFNAMPENAQIFLHALMDEKRSLTLKTSSGRTIKAEPSVLLISSMNPGYPGTFDPQFATRSRMVSMEIGYPPLIGEAKKDDPNQEKVYDVSEALRMARQVDSLADMTYEANLKQNDFVKMWDHYVNGIENGSAEPTQIQRFDIDTILTIVQFTDKLRQSFIDHFEQTRKRDELDVTQPITGRELRRMAYKLSNIPETEKSRANPEKVARDLIEEFYLTHIDKIVDRDKIRKAISQWTSKKRVRK